jgi:hypothetical protein
VPSLCATVDKLDMISLNLSSPHRFLSQHHQHNLQSLNSSRRNPQIVLLSVSTSYPRCVLPSSSCSARPSFFQLPVSRWSSPFQLRNATYSPMPPPSSVDTTTTAHFTVLLAWAGTRHLPIMQLRLQQHASSVTTRT